MIHGPCRVINQRSSCMQEGKCTKYYPEEFTNKTSIGEDGYPVYRRIDNGRTAVKNGNGNVIDNSNIVPYNIDLLMKYDAHMNVELCNKYNTTKYLFKYMNKGPDVVVASVKQTNVDGVPVPENEITV
ncbi:hypothetical protein SOVF_200010, partial [Spinacia oleracea]